MTAEVFFFNFMKKEKKNAQETKNNNNITNIFCKTQQPAISVFLKSDLFQGDDEKPVGEMDALDFKMKSEEIGKMSEVNDGNIFTTELRKRDSPPPSYSFANKGLELEEAVANVRF